MESKNEGKITILSVEIILEKHKWNDHVGHIRNLTENGPLKFIATNWMY